MLSIMVFVQYTGAVMIRHYRFAYKIIFFSILTNSWDLTPFLAAFGLKTFVPLFVFCADQ